MWQELKEENISIFYKDDSGYHFMNTESFEQTFILRGYDQFSSAFLKEGQEVEILFHADTETPLTCELPTYVVLKVTYTEPGMKGNTATNAMKNGTVETGANVRIPLFIETGELIRVDTRTGIIQKE